ncbi:hypothetical protein FGO68_gene2159 [Halteria grandinella]|uniref:Uncharacterized protein n=1 Tax=Halteria grandinella TaxID=5974 RepID=A0A8J8T450_HALGN|nr:hypothetical protein FGO68_gene2159 [Halteria grandinella]
MKVLLIAERSPYPSPVAGDFCLIFSKLGLQMFGGGSSYLNLSFKQYFSLTLVPILNWGLCFIEKFTYGVYCPGPGLQPSSFAQRSILKRPARERLGPSEPMTPLISQAPGPGTNGFRLTTEVVSSLPASWDRVRLLRPPPEPPAISARMEVPKPYLGASFLEINSEVFG